jgi:hypothetical protein
VTAGPTANLFRRSLLVTLDQAIAQLTELRKQMGGDAPLIMVDEEPVYFVPDDNSYWVREAKEAGITPPDFQYLVVVTDVPPKQDEEEPEAVFDGAR